MLWVSFDVGVLTEGDVYRGEKRREGLEVLMDMLFYTERNEAMRRCAVSRKHRSRCGHMGVGP